jgi:hypothetical protein
VCNRCIIWDGFPQLNTLYASFNFRCVWLHLLMNFSEAWVKLILSSFNFCYYQSYTANREILKPPVLVKSGGGIRNYLYQLSLSSHGSAESNVLGKLQITWRTNLGEPGRLQTQQILGTVSMLQWYWKNWCFISMLTCNLLLKKLSSRNLVFQNFVTPASYLFSYCIDFTCTLWYDYP